MEKQFINVKGPDGFEKQAEVISTFEDDDTKKVFIIYTFNETDESGKVPIYASILIDNKENEEYTFEEITDPNEWEAVQDTIKDLLKPSQDEE